MGPFDSGKMKVFDGEHFELEAFDEVEFDGTPETFTVFVPTDLGNLSRVPEEYDYDMETSHNTFFWDELLPTLIVYCLTFVLGLVGNVLIIFTIFRYRKMKSTTNVFLASLASSDLLLILFCIPVKDLQNLVRGHVENKNRKPSSHCEGEIPMLDNAKGEIKVIHQKDKLSNMLSSRTASPSEPYRKTTGLKNETESDKLTLKERRLPSSNGSSQVNGLLTKLSREIKKCSNYIKKLNGAAKDSIHGSRPTKSYSDVKWRTEGEKTESASVDFSTDALIAYSMWKGKSERTGEEKMGRLKKQHSEWNSRRARSISGDELAMSSSTSSACLRRKSKHRRHTCGKDESRSVDEFCCEQCADLKIRVICMETELERIRQRMAYNETQKHVEEGWKTPEMSRRSSKYQQDCHKHHPDHHHYHYQHQQQQQQQCQKQQEQYCKQRQQLQQPCNQQQLQQFCKQQQQQCQEQLQQCEKPQKQCQQNPLAYYSSKSSSTNIVHKSKHRKLRLKSSTSDCLLNVGMEIKMENVDPVTGQKLSGEVRRDCQQDGNIQCRLYEEGQPPLLLMDTDFEYNPLTGMLFKNSESPKGAQKSATVMLPLKSSREQTLTPESSGGFSKSPELQQACACQTHILKKKHGGRKCVSLEENADVETESCHKNKRTQSLQSQESVEFEKKSSKASEEEPQAYPVQIEEESKAEIPQFSRSSSTRSKLCAKLNNAKSNIPTRRKPTPSWVIGTTSGTSSLSLGVSTISSAPESFFAASCKPSKKRFLQKVLQNNANKTAKSTQTFVKPAKKIEKSEGESQTILPKLQNKEIQTFTNPFKEVGIVTEEEPRKAEPELFLTKPSTIVSMATQNNRKKNSPHFENIGLQTDFPSEAEQYLNDLRIQKKVNLAIAELCFHLAKEKNRNE